MSENNRLLVVSSKAQLRDSLSYLPLCELKIFLNNHRGHREHREREKEKPLSLFVNIVFSVCAIS